MYEIDYNTSPDQRPGDHAEDGLRLYDTVLKE